MRGSNDVMTYLFLHHWALLYSTRRLCSKIEIILVALRWLQQLQNLHLPPWNLVKMESVFPGCFSKASLHRIGSGWTMRSHSRDWRESLEMIGQSMSTGCIPSFGQGDLNRIRWRDERKVRIPKYLEEEWWDVGGSITPLVNSRQDKRGQERERGAGPTGRDRERPRGGGREKSW